MSPSKKDVIHQQFPQFEPALLENIEKESVLKHLEPGDPIMQTGQYIRSNILLLNGLLKVYREDDEGNEFLMYYLEPAAARKAQRKSDQ